MQSYSWDSHYNRGLAKFCFKDYRGAVEDFTDTIKLYASDYKPQNGWFDGYLETYAQVEWAYNDRGLARYYLEDYSGAIQDFSEAIKYGEQYKTTYVHRKAPKKLIVEGNEQEVVDLLLGTHPSCSDYLYNRGIAKFRMKDIAGGSTDLDQARRLKINGYAN